MRPLTVPGMCAYCEVHDPEERHPHTANEPGHAQRGKLVKFALAGFVGRIALGGMRNHRDFQTRGAEQ